MLMHDAAANAERKKYQDEINDLQQIIKNLSGCKTCLFNNNNLPDQPCYVCNDDLSEWIIDPNLPSKSEHL